MWEFQEDSETQHGSDYVKAYPYSNIYLWTSCGYYNDWVASVISQCFLFVMALRNLGSESVGIVMGVSNSLTALFSIIVAFFVVRGIKKKIGRDTA